MPTEASNTATPPKPRRAAPITFWLAVDDVIHALGCSRTKAYEHLRRAAGRRPGERGLLRVPAPVWERYAFEHFGKGAQGA